MFGIPTDNLPRPWIFYTLAAVLVAIVVLMLLQFKFNILPSYLDPRPLKQKLQADSASFWPDAATTALLRVTDGDLRGKKIPYEHYTVMIDMLWQNTRAPTENGKYRHVLHRGSPDIIPSESLDVRAAGSGSSSSSTPNTTVGTASVGLPNRMNPGIMADPTTNDMLIFMDTEQGGEQFRESLRIPDIPLDQPFTLTLVVMDRSIEAYVNCKLEVTKILSGTPKRTENNWYGLAGPARLAGLIQNLRLWRRGLAVSEIRQLCASKIQFSPNANANCSAIMDTATAVANAVAQGPTGS